MLYQIEGRGEEYGVLHFRVSAPQSVAKLLSSNSLTESPDELIWLGSVYVNERRILTSEHQLHAGDVVRVHSRPRRFVKPMDLMERIVFENDDIVVVNKPAGIPVNPLTDNRVENLIGFYREELKRDFLITHRLDIETSGLLVFAKHSGSQAKVNELIREKKIRRLYNAWVENALPAGSYVHYMEPSPKAPKIISEVPQPGWLECRLNILSCDPASIAEAEQILGSNIHVQSIQKLEIELQTGRSQQIRAQLSFLGVPIVGDSLYGSLVLPSPGKRMICLQAFSLNIEGRLIVLPR